MHNWIDHESIKGLSICWNCKLARIDNTSNARSPSRNTARDPERVVYLYARRYSIGSNIRSSYWLAAHSTCAWVPRPLAREVAQPYFRRMLIRRAGNFYADNMQEPQIIEEDHNPDDMYQPSSEDYDDDGEESCSDNDENNEEPDYNDEEPDYNDEDNDYDDNNEEEDW